MRNKTQKCLTKYRQKIMPSKNESIRTGTFLRIMTKRRSVFIQSGRSMVEMLGVLVIIGVLSIGAIVGYKYAVTKYKAVETINEVAKRATVVSMEITQGRQTDFMNEFGITTDLGYLVSANLLEDSSYFEIQIERVPMAVCRRILETNWTVPTVITVNGYDYTGDLNICGSKDDDAPALMTFQFVSDLNRSSRPFGSCQTDADCASPCVKCENDRCVSACSGDEKCAQQISSGEMMCCPKELREGPYCCTIKKNGMCCNIHNQCCPYYKPLIDKNGTCYSCDYGPAIDVAGVKDNCNVCPNRELYNNNCRLKCAADKPLRSYQGDCFSCDTTQLVSIVYVYDNCQVCSNRMLSPNRQYCALKCGEGIYKEKPIMDTNGSCHACDENTVWSVASAPQNCALCPNRTLIGMMCAPKVCPDGQFLGINGTCYRCDEPQPVSVGSSDPLCAACPNRTLGGAWNAFCMIPCGTGIYADKPLMGNNGSCYACDESEPVNLGGVNTSVCSVCDHTDTPREVSGGYCVLKNVCKETQIKDVNGNCRDCNDPEPIQTTTAAVCKGCPQRVAQGNENVWCSLPCDEGINEGKPLPDSRGGCHACDEKAGVFIYGVEINCSVCDNRTVKNNYCVLNE